MENAITSNSFGQILKQWRSQRNFSQLDLSLASNVSQRHISFLESGRANPSRDMVLNLCVVLDVPLRQRNKMLSAAGFAAVYSEFDLSDAEVAPIRRALEFTLRQQEPYPALVIDRYWNQILVNKGAENLLNWLIGDKTVPAEIGPNLVKLMLHPQGIRSAVHNWRTVATHLIQRVHRETRMEDPSQQSQSLFNELLTYSGIEELWRSPAPEDWPGSGTENWQVPLLSTVFSQFDQQLSFFTTLTTLGTPHDITLQEIRLECLFPADDATDELWRSLF